MGSFLAGLGHIIKTGFDMTDTGHRLQQDQQQKQDSYNQFVTNMLDSGAKPVMNMNGTDEVNEGGSYRQVDPTRLVTHKRADGAKIRFELPTLEETRKRKAAAQVQTITDEFQGTTGMRKTQGDESVDLAGREQTARLGANRADEETNRSKNGINLPPSLSEALGISPEENRRYLPSEANALSNVNDNMEQAAARKAKPTRTVQSSQKEEDDNGNVVQVVTYSDGSTEKTPLGAIGKKTKPTGQLSAYESYRMNRQDRLDAEKKTDTKGITAAQKQVDTLEGKQAKVRADHDKALAEYTQLQTDLGAQSGVGPFKSNKLGSAERKKAQERSAKLVGIMAGAQTDHASLEAQKQAANERRVRLMKGASTDDAETGDDAMPQSGNASAAAASQAASPVTVTLPMDGSPQQGKTVTFANQAAAVKFRKEHPGTK